MDFGNSKQKELGDQEDSLMLPLVDFESLWKTHPSLPPGFSKEQEVQPQGPWMPGTPVKPSPPMDMDDLWKNHPSLPPGFAGFNWLGRAKEASPDSQNVSPLDNKETGDSGKVDCENGGQVGEDNYINLEDLGYGSSNKGIETWEASLANISFTELLGLAYSAAPSDDTTPLHTPHVSLFPGSQESSVVNPGSNQWSYTKNMEGPISNYHGQNQNEPSSPTIGLVSTAESKQNAGSIDGVACPNIGLAESIPLQNTATVGIASSVESILTHEKGSKKKIDLNKKPRQQKPKKKKHRPKVVVDDDGKKKKIPKSKSKARKVTPKTPKPLTPKPVILKRKRKEKKKPLGSEAPEEPPTKSCKKGLNFELENLLTEEIYAQRDQNVNQITHQYQLRNANRSCKWRFDLNLEFQYDDDESYENEVIKRENGITGEMNMVDNEMRDLKSRVDQEGEGCSDCNSMRVYRRIFRRDQCLSNSKKMGPVFPKIYKKKRSQRRRREAMMWFVTTARACQTASPLSVIRRKKRSNMFTPRRNLASLIAIPICDELPWNSLKKGIPSVKPKRPKKTVPKRVTDIGEGICDQNCMAKHSPTSTTPPRQSSKKKRKGQTKNMPLKIEGQQANIIGWEAEEVRVDSLIQKLELLSISDKINQLVPYQKSAPKGNQLVRYQAKKPAPKVDLDPETLKMWNLIVLKNRSEGAEEEMDKKDEKRWEEEREVFRGRVKSFLACMHLLQGDRRFHPWKGSVLDSVVGVFLTQNVSDKLSSSAFMALAALFPLPSTGNDGACYLVDEDEEDEEEDCQTRDQIQFVSATESNPHCMESFTSYSEQRNEMGETENKNLNNSNEGKRGKTNDKEDHSFDWDSLRRFYSNRGRKSRIHDARDSLDWEAVRDANVTHVAKAISTRGMNNVLAARIKDFLDRLVRDHGKLDLEWLRDVPPEKAKDYLLSIRGLGLKSVECVRLLTLHHHAFPVDTNVGRITVRLGWVPLQPLPSDVYLHSLDQYPPMDTIQKYLWPRLCTLDQKTLYELHYQMITFGKVFCTKKNPYCDACPLRGDCKHYASVVASRLPLIKNGGDGQLDLASQIENQPAAPKEEGIPNYVGSNLVVDDHVPRVSVSILEDGPNYQPGGTYNNCEPIIEMPTSPRPKSEEKDIEDFCDEDFDEIPTIRLDEEFGAGIQNCPHMYPTPQEEDHGSQALVSVATSIPARKLKNISRLRTEHHVYELPDSHHLLTERGMRRESCDPCPFLFAIWSPGETADSFEQPQRRCNLEGSGELCKDETCSFCNATREQDSQIIRGTLLIPCRTAMRGSFPLNGTYFQVNEVFADDESSRNPIIVRRTEIWNLPRRMAYFGTSATSIFRGLSIMEIQNCFWQGFICVRGFNRKTRAPKPLVRRLHISPSHMGKAKAGDDEE